ncbi:2-phospho-L-lactate transferase [Methanobacterium paludis]|uniref:2-phospho-L-lactate transferase n=1 Tax=Methanobacterium paludis (strain DSM 25820 / JCM 18151 / SWAN1) TaxID=868131 RepID=F6D1M4_METPW|nr:2-phospho-L-lactate transferase [Methanobacterium paludis]AEG17252.1 LPPG:FO 2-phospho-L-lactate transferase [Methanobacterium paludis]
MITILSGGTGTPKLIQGIVKLIDPKDINIVVNTLENSYFSGVYVAADVDTVMYTLAEIINEKTWYGIDNDTFITHETLKEINCPETLKIGDRDRATKIQKTMLMEQYPLSKVVNIQRKSLGVESHVIPMSDEESHLKIKTDEGDMEFHKFLIERRGEPEVLDLEYNSVKPAHGVIESIEEADLVVIGPSNPVTSIGPIISMEGVSDALKKSYVTAVSPIIGGTPVSGPAAKFMRALGHEVSCRGVAAMYQEFLDKFIVDTEDRVYKKEIEKLISDVVVTNTNMKNIGDKMMLARSILGEIL